MSKIKIGIIGCGSITEKRHAPEYKMNPNAEMIAFYDIKRERAELMAEKFGGTVVEDYMDIIKNPEIDAISDCTPNFMHFEISSKALEEGKHVLCEKPMTKTREEAERLVEIEEGSGKIFMMDHNQRFTKAHKYIKELIENKKLGRVLSFRTTFGHSGPESWTESKSKNTWFFKKEQSEYGVVGDLGVHKLDLIRYLTGDEVLSVTGIGGVLDKKFEDGSPIEVYDNAICLLKMKSGAIGTGTFSWTYYGEEDNSTIIYMEEGIIRIYDDPKYQIEIINKNGERESLEIEPIQTNDNQTSTGVIDEFIDTILMNKKSPVNSREGVASIKIVEAFMISIKEGKEIVID